MARPFPASPDQAGRLSAVPAGDYLPQDSGTQASAVSWGAIFAGAAAAAALSMILLILGVGLGLSSVSPWASEGISASSFGTSTIVWLTFTQLAASAMGGYLAGRLRTRWIAVHTDEVYFRDTAHGFLAWAVASLVTASLLASAVSTIVGGGVQAGAQLAGGAASVATTAAAGTAAVAGSQAASKADDGNSAAYFVDSLFRKGTDAAAPAADASAANTSPANSSANTAAPVAEVGRIFAKNLQSPTLAGDDLRYVGQLVSQRTGLPQAEAEQRVSGVYTKLQTQVQATKTSALDSVNQGRKASAYASLWLFVSLLIGAFTASWMATFGGRQRDL